MKKNRFVWCLYDFANSIGMIVFLFYFSQWLVVDQGKPDWWYNSTLVISSILFILTAPFVTSRIDATGRKVGGLRLTTTLALTCYLATALITLFAPSQALLAVIIFTLAMYLYLLSFSYYTPMITDISSTENRSTVSGYGQAANALGQVVGLLVVLPFASGTLHLFGAPGRAQTLLPATLLFALLALPMLLSYRESTSHTTPALQIKKTSYKNLWETTKQIFRIRNLGLLLIGYFLFSDALITFANNFPLFLEKVHGASDATKTYLTAAILTLSVLGAAIFGRVADKRGNSKMLNIILGCWVLILPLIAFSPFTLMVIACLIGGILFGPVWGISRAMVAEHAPPAITASSFGFYVIAERFATLIGPVTWSVVLGATRGSGTISYSYAITAMAILVFLSLLFLRKINRESIIKDQPSGNPV